MNNQEVPDRKSGRPTLLEWIIVIACSIFLIWLTAGCVAVQKNDVHKKNHIVKTCPDGSKLEDFSEYTDNSKSFALAGLPRTRQYENSAAVGTEESRPGLVKRVGYGVLGTLSGPPFPNSYGYYPSYGYGSSLPGATYVNPGPSVYRTYPDQYSRPPGAVYIKPGPAVYNHPGYPQRPHSNQQHRGPWQR